MISFVEGKVEEKQPTHVILNVGGVGYEVFIPLSSHDRIPREGQTCRLLTHDLVREDAHLLYGFATEAERRMFNLLIGVTGIGPKIALSALSGLSVREMKSAVVDGDAKRLSSISGIGKKTAERIVLELRHKIGPGEALEAIAGADEATPEERATRDAVMALIALGYKMDEARALVKKAGEDGKSASVEELVRKALAR
jgi:Holliday junction DNA helicase RuvA